MLNSFDILKAMNGIDGEAISSAGRLLFIKARRRRGLAGRALLIAAVLTALFGVTAYSMGWFGLGQRSYETEPVILTHSPQPQEQPEKSCWLSANGYKGSPEYMANREWTEYFWSWRQEHEGESIDESYLQGRDEEFTNICSIYGAYNDEQNQKLREIADKYGLKLHTERFVPVSLEDFYALAGTEKFLSDEVMGSGYVYEDGSFRLEGGIAPEQQGAAGRSFSLNRHMAGTLVPWFAGSGEPEEYEEWEYTNSFGNKLVLSQKSSGFFYAFYDRDGAFLELSAGFEFDKEKIGSRAEAEEICDNFDFEKAAAFSPGGGHAHDGPNAAQDPGEAMSLDEILTQKEFAAGYEYISRCRELLSGNTPVPPLPRKESWPEGYEILRETGEKYSLLIPEDYSFLLELSPEQCRAELKKFGITQDIYMPGAEAGSVITGIYSNGTLTFMNGWEWYFIPKDTLFTCLRGIVRDNYEESWFYRCSEGETVHISHSPIELGYQTVIAYSSPRGYVLGLSGRVEKPYAAEHMAEQINFAAFK